MNKISAFFSAMLAVSSFNSIANAQGVMDEVYGRGVHAYYAGQDDKAIEWFDAAISAGSEDPRVYYYRGLANIRSGGAFEAGLGDFEQAANLEITSGRVVNVGKALERIQGETRRQIEDIRLKARLANKDKLPRTPVVPTNPNLDATTDPFADDRGLIGGEPEEMAAPPAAEVPPATDASPFDAAPATPDPAPADAASPFGDDAAPAPAADADPFGAGSADAPASDNPFGN